MGNLHVLLESQGVLAAHTTWQHPNITPGRFGRNAVPAGESSKPIMLYSEKSIACTSRDCSLIRMLQKQTVQQTLVRHHFADSRHKEMTSECEDSDIQLWKAPPWQVAPPYAALILLQWIRLLCRCCYHRSSDYSISNSTQRSDDVRVSQPATCMYNTTTRSTIDSTKLL